MKKCLIEFIGTFFLVLVIGLAANPIAIGAILMCMVYMGGHLSGAHYNPAVSLALFLDGKLSFLNLIGYWIAQFLGGAAAVLKMHYLIGKTFEINAKLDFTKAGMIEFLFTFALVLVVLNVADHPKTEKNSFYGLAIGFTVLAAAYAGGPLSGGAFNPAVGLSPIVSKLLQGNVENLHMHTLYILFPFLGGAFAWGIFQLTKDPE